MPSRRKDSCGARFRRAPHEPEPHVPETQELQLTSLGEALVEALRGDERFADLIADPFGEQGPATAA